MITPITIRTFRAPPIDRAEILRYARGGSETEAIAPLLDEVLAEAAPVLSFRAVYRELDAEVSEEGAVIGPLTIPSRSLATTLRGARRAILLAATVGPGIDRLLLRYGRLSPARALLLQAVGAERVEALAAALTHELQEKYGRITRRFSPGYGDLPLSLQADLFPLLDCERALGLSLGSSYLMSPTKSITAITGVLG